MIAERKKQIQRVWIILLIAVGVLLIGAVLLGVWNALTGRTDGGLFWSSYRYDDGDYEIGEGSIPAEGLTKLEIDWIDGNVRVVSCEDTFVSVSETSDTALTEASLLRWSVRDDGKTLSVRYRKSSYFLGSGDRNKNKTLTVRIPEYFFERLESLSIVTVSSATVINGITCRSLLYTTDTGTLGVSGGVWETVGITAGSGDTRLLTEIKQKLSAQTAGGDVEVNSAACPPETQIVTQKGNAELIFPSDTSFRLVFNSPKGKLDNAFPSQSSGAESVCGDGKNAIRFTSQSGSLRLRSA